MDAMNKRQIEKMFRPAEVAERYCVSEGSVRRWVREGDLRAVRLGSSPRASIRVPETALAEFVREGS
jgi:excisionase family DNA binding protein